MSPRKGYSREEVLRFIQEFARDSGRPPRRSEPGFGKVVTAAEKEFGSWNYALKIAGLQTYASWHKKETLGGRICALLHNTPMTLVELREEFMKFEKSNSQSNNSLSNTLLQTIRNTHEIKSLGPRKSRVYFLQGEEKLAENHMGKAPSLDKKQDFIYCSLIKPMTKNEIRSLFPEAESVSCIDRLLQELVFAELVGKVEFSVGSKGRHKYNTTELFGKIACQRYYFRFDCPQELAELVAENIPRSGIQDSGFERSLTHHLKRILPADVYVVFLRIMTWREEPEMTPKSSQLDDYLQ